MVVKNLVGWFFSFASKLCDGIRYGGWLGNCSMRCSTSCIPAFVRETAIRA